MNNLKMLKTSFTFITLFSLLFSFSCSEGNEVDFPLIGEPVLSITQDYIKVDMTFETIVLDGALTLAIPEFENSTVDFYADPDPALGTHMTVNLWIGDLLNGDLQLLPPQRLPDGRNLPGVAKGFLPSVAFQVPQMGDMTFYIGKDFFGFFAPYDNKQETETMLTARLYNNGARLGNISIVGSEDVDSRGVLVLMNTDLKVKNRLKKIFNRYQ